MTTSTTNAPFIPREDIEKRANEVLRQHGLETIPVDPVVLANQLGIKVFNAKFSDDSLVGMIAKRGADVTLLVNQSDPPARKRFTIAHELGHHFLHLMEDGEFVDGEANLFRQGVPEDEGKLSPDHRREIQANMFAAALLMPFPVDKFRVWPAVNRLSCGDVDTPATTGRRAPACGCARPSNSRSPVVAPHGCDDPNCPT